MMVKKTEDIYSEENGQKPCVYTNKWVRSHCIICIVYVAC